MPDNPILKKFQPEDIRSPYWGFPILGAAIYVSVLFVLTGYKYKPLEEYVLFSIVLSIGAFSCSYLIYANIKHSLYVETTDSEISVKNKLKIKRGSLEFNKIKELWITKRIYIIYLKDIHDKTITIVLRDEFVPLLDEVLEKSVNLERVDIDFKYFSKKFKGIEELKEKYFSKLQGSSVNSGGASHVVEE